jgi:hypothetical protein
MATYTVAQIKDLSTVKAISGWSDDKILLFQSSAELILDGLDADKAMSGYLNAYAVTVMRAFDWLASNPTGLKQSGRGKVSETYSDVLPNSVLAPMQKYIDGSNGSFSPAKFMRKDIGLR